MCGKEKENERDVSLGVAGELASDANPRSGGTDGVEEDRIRPNMNTTELATANRSDPRTITKAIYILSKAGLIEKNGGRFSLKQI
jgi:hypothetical protein